MLRFLSIIAFALFAGTAQAQSPTPAQGIWCDTPEQLRSLYELIKKGDALDAALKHINADAPSPACTVAIVVIIPGELVDRISDEGKVYGIFRVLVLAFQNGDRFVQLPSPMIQYGSRPLLNETSA